MSAQLVLLDFTIQQIEGMQLPEDPGSMLRGAFGHALKNLSETAKLLQQTPYIQQTSHTQSFASEAAQAYNAVFEPTLAPAQNQARGYPNPYVLKLPNLTKQTLNNTLNDGHISANQQWQFSQLLIGKEAIQHLPTVILAWSQALSQGIGSTHKRYQGLLKQVTCQDQVLYKDGQLRSFNQDTLPYDSNLANSLIYQQLSTIADNRSCSLRLCFKTQFRIQHQGKVAYQAQQLNIKSLFYALYNRVTQCHQLYDPDSDWQIGFSDFAEYKALIDTLILSADVEPASLTRYSSRQKRSITLYGLTGSVLITATNPTLKKLLPLLHLGELLHIGKSTALGLGEYQLQLVHTSSELM